ncbi:iron-sulfur cluster biosynthesis family protein [Peribacillus asahii]
MYIEWTEKALTKVTEKMNGDSGYLLLKYDTDDCGCAVNGVTALWLV